MESTFTKRIRITDKCDQDCIFCSGISPVHQKNYSRRNIEKEISQRNGAMRLNITGGEPTVCRCLPEFITLAKKTGYKNITLLTNGNNLADKKYALALKNSGLTEAIVSICHFDLEISDDISNRKGFFLRKTQGMKNLIKLKIKTTANIAIFTLNIPILPELIKYLYENLELQIFAFSILEPNCKKVRERLDLIPDLAETMQSLYKAVDYCKRKNLQYHIPYDGAVPPCVFKKYKLSINKPERVMGADFDSSRIYFEFCRHCHEKPFCRGVLKEYHKMCADILKKNG